MSDAPETFLTRSPDETRALAERLARELQAPVLFLLIGELGAGKTIFAKGLAAGLGINPDEVVSPSFVLVTSHRGRWPFYHIDLYRVDDPRVLTEHLGLEEIFASRAVVAIEWGEKVPPTLFPRNLPNASLASPWLIYRVELSWVDETTRRITIRRDAPASSPHA